MVACVLVACATAKTPEPAQAPIQSRSEPQPEPELQPQPQPQPNPQPNPEVEGWVTRAMIHSPPVTAMNDERPDALKFMTMTMVRGQEQLFLWGESATDERDALVVLVEEGQNPLDMTCEAGDDDASIHCSGVKSDGAQVTLHCEGDEKGDLGCHFSSPAAWSSP